MKHAFNLQGHAGPARRSPNLLFKVPEGSKHGKLAGSQDVYHRRSFHNKVKTDDNVPQRIPATSPRVNRRRTDVTADIDRNQNEDTNYNTNTNMHGGHAVAKKNILSKTKNFFGNEIMAEDYFDIGKLEAKLNCAVKFYANIIDVFGEILKAPKNSLTADQYSALKLILEALIHKQVNIFNMLPVLKKLQNADAKTQFKIVIHALTHNVPDYIACVAKYLEKQIDKNLLYIEGIIGSIDRPASFLAGLDPKLIDISSVKNNAEEMEPFDDASEVTMKTLGPVFVKLFYALKNHKIRLTPTLFGVILANLPVGKFDPVLEEYVDYVRHVMQTNVPPNWDEIESDIKYGTPYEVVETIIKKLLDKGNISSDLARALKYILMHLKEVPNTFADEYYQDMGMLLNNGGDLERMILLIPDDVSIPELGELKNRMIAYIKQKEVYEDLKGMNKYKYEKPIHILLALLARIQSRSEDEAIKEAATKLLSILKSNEEVGSVRPIVSADVDLLMLLENFNVPGGDPYIPILAKEIQNYLNSNLDLLLKLQKVLLEEDKSNCRRPTQCLLTLFTNILDPGFVPGIVIPPELIQMIRQLRGLIKSEIHEYQQCETQDGVCVVPPESFDYTMTDPYPVQPAPLPIPDSVDPPVPPLHPTPDFNENSYTENEHFTNENSYTDNAHFPTYTDDGQDDSHPPTTVNEFLPPNTWNDQLYYPVEPADYPVGPPNPQEPSIPELQPQPEEELKPQPQPIPTVIPVQKPVPRPTFRPTPAPENSQSVNIPFKPMPWNPLAVLPSIKPPAWQQMYDLLPQAENEPFLPPNLSYDKPIYTVFPKGNGPPYMCSEKPNGFDVVIEYPSIKILLQELNPNTPFSSDELPDIPLIFGPLKIIVGPHFVEDILGKPVDKKDYPTTISLIYDLLTHALSNPKVAANPSLVRTIQQYLKGIDYINISALSPVVIDSQKIPSDIIYVTFDPNNPNVNSMDPEPPNKSPTDFTTLAIYHPKFWVQQVDPVNPYGTLLPSQVDGEDNPIQKLINDGSLLEILGPDFNPFIYPNRGTLLFSVLQKLMASKRVELNPRLVRTLGWYIKSIRNVAMYNKVPSYQITHLLEMHHNSEVNWQPDTATLITALPKPQNRNEFNMINLIKAFLKMPNLLELLGIRNLAHSITRGELLKKIFYEAIWGNKIVLDSKTLAALKYYEGKILMRGFGALPVVWTWVQMFLIQEEVPLGEVIESVIDYDKLPVKLQVAYNDLMTYFSENPHLLQNNDDFPFEKYPSKGSFLNGLFQHFMIKHGVSRKAKKYIRQLLPHIKLKGRGMEPMHHITIDDIAKSDIVKAKVSALMNG